VEECAEAVEERGMNRNGENQDDDEEELMTGLQLNALTGLQLQLLNGQGNVEVEMEVGVKNNWELGVDR
jgi:hypothetical protein